MKNIYLENTPLAIEASKECHKLAQQKGYEDWWDWYKQEQKLYPEKRSSELESSKIMMEITKKFRKNFRFQNITLP